MASEPIRDPKSDHLLTPENSAFVIIDYQPVQVNSIASMDRQLLVNNIVGTAKAVEATGRKKLIMTALWTEACLTFPALDALRDGYEVYVVADAVGGTSVTAHEMGLRRIEQAGGKMISAPQLFCELQRDWKRSETVPAFMNLFIETGGTAGIQFSYDRED